MINIGIALQHYKRKDIQQAIIGDCDNKEVSVRFPNNAFGKRPDILQYPSDVMEMVKAGASSFHLSEENWYNALRLSPELKRKELDELRKDWDLVIDIDCDELEYSKIAADLIIKALKYHNINSISCKFSGNHGFHIGIPAEAFPKRIPMEGTVKETRLLFPEAPRRIALYLKHVIRKKLGEGILKFNNNDVNNIVKSSGKSFSELVKNNEFDPFELLELDTILLASRHLFRSCYSFNEKSGLISIPVKLDKVLEFNKQDAEYSKVKVNPELKFLDRSKAKSEEAKELIIQAFDLSVKEEDTYKEIVKQSKKSEYKKPEDFEFQQEAIPEDFFPPCVVHLLQGINDGKKRSLFVLINFLNSVGWSYEDIENLLDAWNKNNEKKTEALREVYIKGQLKYHKQQKKTILPPNCANKNYYTDIGICKPDGLCRRIKNPVQYSKKKVYLHNLNNKKGKKAKKKVVKTEESKAKNNKTDENPEKDK